MKGMVILRQPILFAILFAILFVALPMLLVGCTRAIFRTTALLAEAVPPPDPTLEELVSLLQKQREEIPPLKGLMKVTIKDKGDKGFWGKWSSVNGVIKIAGYNLLGGTLFNLKVAGSEVSLESSENNFHGSREALEQYLVAHRSEIRIEWVTLLDWIARGGLPDLSTTTHPTLRKDVDRKGNLYFILSLLEQDKGIQDVYIDRKSLRIKTVMLHHAERLTRMRFDDYRAVGNISFPFFIEIELHTNDPMRMEIVFKEVKVMPE